MIDDLRARYLPRFVGVARERIGRGSGLIKNGDGEEARATASEFHAFAGEAGILGLSDLADAARAGEAAAHRLAGGDRSALIDCARAWRDLHRRVTRLAAELAVDARPTVVVVDDSAIVAEQIADALQTGGMDAHIANTGRAAIDLVRAQQPQAILIDVNLDGADVRDLCAAVRGVSPKGASIILVSGMERDELAALASEAGANGFVGKGDGIDAIVGCAARAAGVEGAK